MCYRYFFLFIIIVFPQLLEAQGAQTKTVSGSILDGNRKPLPGVTITVKNSNRGTVTNKDGKFTLQVPENAKLVITYLGYKNIEVPTQELSKYIDGLNISLVVAEIKYDTDADGILDEYDPLPNKRNVLKRFPTNYPTPSAKYAVTGNVLVNKQYITLGKVDALLSAALQRNGYDEKGYYYMPNGFALVTQMEQFNDDGTSKAPPGRWETAIKADLNDFWDYVVNIFDAPEGNFRIIAFLVTDEDVIPSGRIPKQEEMMAWVFNGSGVLPNDLKNISISTAHNLTILIYEYKKISGAAPILKQPGSLTAKDHLIKAGILAHLP